MRDGLFTRLAITNIKKNKSTYIPYMITCIGCIAMTYMMLFICGNPGIDSLPGGGDIQMIISLGIIVICIFSFIFLLYSNSFLMKRRQKELGLYNILGMEKAHISRMMFRETVFTAVFSIAAGLAVGILGSKLALLFLLKLVHIPAQFGFYVSGIGLIGCVIIFGGIFLITLLNNMRKVHLTQPIELLRGSSVGEKEPKAKWLIALIGFICLGSGYYIAITVKSPLEAISLFFVAVLLVMAGTYLVFTAGSIAVLKMMRWKKSFYYKMKNFTSISGMIYRMKQNAVGLASICILSTGVLLMLSTTVSLNFGMEDLMQNRYPYEINLSLKNISREEGEAARRALGDAIEAEQIPCDKIVEEMSLSIACQYNDNEINFKRPENVGEITVENLTVIPVKEYERIHEVEVSLSKGELLAYRGGEEFGKDIKIHGNSYAVKEWLKQWPLQADEDDLFGNIAVVVTDEDYETIFNIQKEVYGDYASMLDFRIGIDVKGSKEDEITYGRKLISWFDKFLESGQVSHNVAMIMENRQENYQTFYSMNGGLLFLGIFLGGLFLMGAAMIIYYKQMSEGYEDRERFEIMQKVGMSRKEVKSSVRRQILMVFFAPLLMAALHITMAFPLVNRLLRLMNMANTNLFILCTVVTIIVFASVYGIIYSITAKVYYKIVERTV
ncbi:MAG: ABC transporter permease [Eubacteriales bacterium]|nr:ABC transporter permease [Eubacteriales bacterium]